MSKKIEDIIARIQREAKSKVAALSKKTPKSGAAISSQKIKEQIKEQINSAYGVATTNQKSREYFGNLSEKLTKIVQKCCTTDSEINTEIYPPNCKFMTFDKNNGNGFLVIEDSPRFRTIFDASNGPAVNYRIALPYVIYIIKFIFHNGKFSIDRFGVAFSKKPIKSMDQKLLGTHLPHTHNSSSVCFPLPKNSHNSITELTSYAIQSFWSSAFHYYFNRPFKVNGKTINSFQHWSTIDSQLDILKGSFKIGCTIQQQLKMFGMNIMRSANNKKIMLSIIQEFHKNFSADELSKMMLLNTEEIIQNAIENALQPEN